MAFDPRKFGATMGDEEEAQAPAKSTFNPRKFGATVSSSDAALEDVKRQLEGPKDDHPIARAVGKFFTGSTQKFGETLGTAAGAAGASKSIGESNVAEQESRLKQAQLLNKPGTTEEQKARIREHLGQAPAIPTASEQIPSLDKSAKQVFGEGLGTGLEALSGGALGKVTKAPTLGKAVLQGVKTGATYGALGGTSTALQEDKSALETAKSATTGAIIGGLTGGALGATGYGAEKLVDKYGPTIAAKRLATQQEKVDKAVGQIGQSKIGDIETHKAALLSLDADELKKIKSYDDLDDVVSEKLTALKNSQDAVLAAAPEPKPLASFEKTVGSGKTEVKSNPVVDAIDHLEELYKDTSDPESLSNILALRDKAETVGLNAAEVNQLARDYGAEFGNKAFSPKTGDALTSVNAQSFENTRKAVKEAARGLLPDDASKAIDASMSDLLEFRRSVQQVNEKVNALKNKIKERGLGERIGRVLGQAFDVATFGTGKGFVTKAFFPSGVGEKQLNYLDIQKLLPKNLKLLEAAVNASDDKLVAFVARLAKAMQSEPAQAFVARKEGEKER